MRQLHAEGILHDASWIIIEGDSRWRPFAECFPPRPATPTAQPVAGFTKHAFISHSSRDHDLAVRICEILENHGLICWIAPRDISPGAPYDEEILRGIATSQTFILLLSDFSNQSPHVKRELMCALRAGHAIYPIRIQEIQPGPKLEYLLEGIHWVDAWTPPLEAHLDRLAQLIANSDPDTATAHHAGKRKRLGKRALWKPRSRRGQWIATLVLLTLLGTGGWWVSDQVKKGAVSNLLSSFAQNVADRVGNMLSFSGSQKPAETPPPPSPPAAPKAEPPPARPSANSHTAPAIPADPLKPGPPRDPNAKIDQTFTLSWARDTEAIKTHPSHAQIIDENEDVLGELALIDNSFVGYEVSTFTYIDREGKDFPLCRYRFDDSVGHVRIAKIGDIMISGKVTEVSAYHGNIRWLGSLTVEVTVKR